MAGVGHRLHGGDLKQRHLSFHAARRLGVAGVVGTAESRVRGSGFPIATAFFAGLVLSLTALGAVAGVLGLVATRPLANGGC
ncbi:MAG TPA: hypothetical protein VJ692_09065 [Nitrospiraceae bacterium]|nr:hypothetical protein [Nitrospiraceae bacterium]